MDLKEANFILNQLTISQPCINGYMYIGVEEVDQAIDIINNELKTRKLKIAQLEREIEELKSRRHYELNKENLKQKQEMKTLKNELLNFKTTELVTI